ncbi:WD40 repeat protein [Archangium gephyra]|uniref:High-affnity carbon uptake protein Hat/HatR n=1 Tax=Archangium gephyra TaxID=48 RepID=A0AAC8QD59_9BACT|nr:hypothetical protein [Archangium gephyra]AKJ05294.1 High-affnity carbon uptake protein Hat/HatR [Archangium gephyra]REG35982.1 WD40 repeat protein [Archangium gephyra]
MSTHELLESMLASGKLLDPATAGAAQLNPFPGPQPYRTSDRDRFFGREEMTQRLVSHILAYSCTTLSGPSGAGKSSLVRAGAIPLLEEEHEHRTVIIDGWPSDKAPLDWLVESMFDQLELERGAASGEGVDGAPGAHEALDGAVRLAFLGSEQPILLYLDQLEQLFFPSRDVKRADALLERLEALTRQSTPRVRLLLALREDYLGPFRERVRGRRVLLEHGFRLGPLTVAEMQSVACRAAAAGRPSLKWSPEQLRELLLQVRTPGQDKSPEAEVQATYAQIVCRTLWEQEVRGEDPVVLIEAAPILNRYLESTLDELGPLRTDAERLLEDRLIDETGGRTLLMENQARTALRAESAEQVLLHLERARVLRAEEHQGSRYFELGHDWLARKVLELKRERLRREWEQARQQRQEAERRKREEAEARYKLQQAQERKQREAEERRLYEEAEAAEKRRLREETELRVRGAAQRTRKLRHVAMTALTALLLVSTLLVWMALQQAVVAEARSQALAREGRAHDLALMAGARELASRNQPALASKLLLELFRPEEMRGWLALTYEVLNAHPPQVTLGERQALSAAFSLDGRFIVTASEDGTARVWTAGGAGPLTELRGHTGAVLSAAFSPDGRLLVTASEDGTARVWNADGSGAPVVLQGHGKAVLSAAFSPDGQRVLTASEDGTARVWSTGGAGPLLELRGHQGGLTSAAFSPDGQLLVTASEDGTARVWSASAGRPLTVLQGHEWLVRSAAFSADGRRIVTASWDGTARLWNVEGTGTPVVLQGHEGWVVSAVFSPDGQRVLTASEDGTARVWRADGTKELRVLQGYGGSVRSAVFSPDGRSILTTSKDGTARVWHTDGPELPARLPAQEEKIISEALLSEGQRVRTASEDGTARVWRTDGSRAPVVLPGHEGQLTSAAFSQDGRHVATATLDGTVRVWSASEGRPLTVLQGHESQVTSVAFSPDGQRLVTASSDGTARVWNADGSGIPLVLRDQGEGVTAAAFSPDGQSVITLSAAGSALRWPLSFSALRQALDDVNADCLPIELRRLYLDESDTEARRQYETCEQRHGRLTPSEH